MSGLGGRVGFGLMVTILAGQHLKGTECLVPNELEVIGRYAENFDDFIVLLTI